MSSSLDRTEEATAPLPVVGRVVSFWSPSDSRITAHSGAPIPSDLAFVAAPPIDEIGEVLSAHSTVHTIRGGKTAQAGRVAWSILGVLVMGSFAYGILVSPWFVMLAFPIAILGSSIGISMRWQTKDPENSTTYVGTNGAAKFTWTKNAGVIASDILRYSDVGALYVMHSKVSNNNYVSSNSNYSFDFGGIDPKTNTPRNLLMIRGEHPRSKHPSRQDEIFYFGIAAEAAFTRFAERRYRPVLEQGGEIHFNVGTAGFLTLSNKGLRIALRGADDYLSREEIGNVKVQNGMVNITRSGKAGVMEKVAGQGVYSMPYSQLSSANLFLSLVEYVRQFGTAS